ECSRAEPSRSARHEVEDPQLPTRAALVAAVAGPVLLEDAPHALAVVIGHRFRAHGATLAAELDLGIRMRQQVPGPGRVLGTCEVRPRDVDRAVLLWAAHEQRLARLPRPGPDRVQSEGGHDDAADRTMATARETRGESLERGHHPRAEAAEEARA